MLELDQIPAPAASLLCQIDVQPFPDILGESGNPCLSRIITAGRRRQLEALRKIQSGVRSARRRLRERHRPFGDRLRRPMARSEQMVARRRVG